MSAGPGAPLGLGLQPEEDAMLPDEGHEDDGEDGSQGQLCEDGEEEDVATDDKEKKGKKGKGRGKGKGKDKPAGKTGGKGKGKNKRPKQEDDDAKSARAKARAKAHAKATEDQREWKKCSAAGGCGKWLLVSEFHCGQSKCKSCNNSIRQLQRSLDAQDCRTEVELLASNDEKQHIALLRSFSKAREKSKASSEKLKFNVRTWQAEWKAKEGTRKEEEGEMMWEGEFYEWAATAKAGFLSKTEMQARWEAWKAKIPSYPHDKHGPRGYLRLYVPTKTKIVKFEEATKEKSFTQQEKLGAKATEEQIREKLAMVFDSSAAGSKDPVAMAELMEKALRAFASGGSGGAIGEPEAEFGSSSSFDGGLLGPDVLDLMRAEALKAKKRKKGSDSDDVEGSEDEAAKKDRKEGPPVESPSKIDWLDETKIRKAERSYLQGVETFETTCNETKANMEATLAETRCSSQQAKDALACKP